ncbi:hypothetical protein [Streptomyces sp. NBC_00038]|nr:hypothetical protein [Streptomyces sp. NBC_00038]MCX5555379.1 hypothetical protein [Streptomyces sp. NBC_00038]
MDEVTATAALFRALLTEAARRHKLTSVAELGHVASRMSRAAQPTHLELP